MLKDSSLAFTSWLFLRFLAIINLIAFISIWTQIDGLIGSEGILPAQDYFKLLQERLGPERYRLAPSLFWFNTSDTALHFICGTGIFLSLLLIVNIAPAIILFLLWLFYLSLTVAGQDFLSFQWDILLLETNFVAIFIAPRRLFSKYGKFESPSFLGIWLLRFLLFKLMFLSGAVKLLSGDPTWRDLTALFYHYETQPLPTAIGWYIHQLPQLFQKASVVLMFAIELLVPFLIFTPRKLRIYGFFILISFQIMIFVTGNYCFFNLLTIALCIVLLDDEMYRHLLKIKNREISDENVVPHRWPQIKKTVITFIALFIVIVNLIQIGGSLTRGNFPKPLIRVLRFVSPLRTVNSYGLFSVMTTMRNEIVVQGSADQKNWLDYKFKWKPGDLMQKPRWVAPHQPRLDWQMWFAALGRYQRHPWFINFSVRLLKNSPDVINLLEDNPFQESPPRYVRALLYEYHFTDWEEYKKTGAWWKKEYKGLYLPSISLRN